MHAAFLPWERADRALLGAAAEVPMVMAALVSWVLAATAALIAGCSGSDETSGSSGASGSDGTGASSGDPGSASGGSGGSGGSADGSGSASGGSGGSGGSNIQPVPGCDADDPSLSDAERALVEMPADSWWSAPNTPFFAVCDTPAHEPLHASSGCGAVITAWSGGAWDPDRGQMLVFGGGHNDYWGNELYGFDVATMSWKILVEASTGLTVDNQNKDPLDDGTPVSRHTYDGVQYLGGPHRFFSFGGAMSANGYATTVTWTLDIENGTWQNMQPGGEGTPFNGANGTYWMATAYDPVTDRVFYKSEAGFSIYDVGANTWSRVLDGGYPPLYPDFSDTRYRRGVLDSKRRLFFAFGEKPETQVFVWNIDEAADVSADWKSSGGEAVFAMSAFGVDYDPSADAMVAWGGGTPWVLDLASKTWTAKSGEGAPAAQVDTGTYGRFRYIPRYNVFVLVNEPDEDVRFYKHSAGCGE